VTVLYYLLGGLKIGFIRYHVLDIVSFYFVHIVHRYDNFIVGLRNVSPNVSTPTLFNYTLCGQYPGSVANGTTVSVKCQDNLPPFRYVIVQLPTTYGYLIACEVEVLVRSTLNV